MKAATIQLADISESDKARFFTKVNRAGPLPDQSNPHYTGLDRCWVWTASGNENGYGQFWIQKKLHLAHRVSFLLHGGELTPENPRVLHRCDNPCCVRYDHLFQGTPAINTADMMSKRRQNNATGNRNGRTSHPERTQRGERSGRVKLSDEKVIQLRALHAAGETSMAALADRFGIDASVVSRIVHRKLWRHV